MPDGDIPEPIINFICTHLGDQEYHYIITSYTLLWVVILGIPLVLDRCSGTCWKGRVCPAGKI